MMSFANSFANYPNPMMSQRPTDSNLYELHAIDMSLDALYLHELHDMEVYFLRLISEISCFLEISKCYLFLGEA